MNNTLSERAIILAPRGRDASIAAEMLASAGIESAITENIASLAHLLSQGAGFALATDESFHRADLRPLDSFVRSQEEWSDFPFVLLTERGGNLERNPAAGRFLEILGNVTFLERPFHPTTLVSIARAALRGRLRQYEARERLHTIRDREQELRFALNAGKLGSWVLDIETMQLAASDQCKANFGREPCEQFSYEELLASVHPEDASRMQSAVRRTLESGADYDVEYRCIWPDRSQHWVHIRGRPEADRFGNMMRLVGVSQDITERKASEETLRSFTVELENRVEERTREREAITAQLHEAQKLETLGQLTGGVAHDFNNLLTPIVGTLDLIRRRTDDERSQKLLDAALMASDRAKTLVARLLAFARRQNLEPRTVDIGRLVEGLVDLIKRSIGPTIELRFVKEIEESTALVDSNQLELALLNLAVNARDAMPEGGLLEITISRMEAKGGNHGLAEGEYILVSVADNGSGMSEETMARAVEPFFSTKGVGEGTGLGLSMVHGLAAQSGGTLTLRSATGSGTVATLWLPVAEIRNANCSEEKTPCTRDWQSLKVLLVDDEPLVRDATAAMLEDLGHQVVAVEGASTALGMLRTQSFDLLITDYLMPGMSGLELSREARKLRQALPVLMITGFSNSTDEDFGVTRIAKPFQLEELDRAINSEVDAPQKLTS